MLFVSSNNNTVEIKTNTENVNAGDINTSISIPSEDLYSAKKAAETEANKYEALYTRYKKEAEFLQSVIDTYDIKQLTE